ncbi:MAG: SCO family protein, partial [Kiloniellales bacterium]|nr:SCO family protein [Kiloniellales bacterium]
SGDFEGWYQVIVFGCVRCDGVVPLALDRSLAAIDLLGEVGKRIQPILITVDPEETPDILSVEIPKLHPRLIGLTGPAEELAAARRLYRVEAEYVGKNINGKSVYSAHSFVYLVGPEGEFLTLLPPVFESPVLAEKMKPYIS